METHDHDSDNVAALLAASGLQVSGDELATLHALYVRFASERVAMASIDVGPVEPATTFETEPPADAAG
jgi:hypothetical protein